MRLVEVDREVRSRRPAKGPVDPWRAVGRLAEPERTPGGGTAPSLTLFLAGAECPFTCVYCDLWRYTLDGPTPPGALPRQIEASLAELEHPRSETTVKLYNASNFFDPRAVPREDWSAIADLLRGFPRVVVECHPRLVGDACFELAELLEGRLAVAMGLETVHEQALARLNKRMDLADFERAAEVLLAGGLGVRAFVLVGAPYLPAGEAVDWAVKSIEFAIGAGAQVISLLPVRGGNGFLDGLRDSGDWCPPHLRDLEDAVDRALSVAGYPPGPVILADLWEVETLEACADCRAPRLARLGRENLSGRVEPVVRCRACSSPEDLR